MRFGKIAIWLAERQQITLRKKATWTLCHGCAGEQPQPAEGASQGQGLQFALVEHSLPNPELRLGKVRHPKLILHMISAQKP